MHRYIFSSLNIYINMEMCHHIYFNIKDNISRYKLLDIIIILVDFYYVIYVVSNLQA